MLIYITKINTVQTHVSKKNETCKFYDSRVLSSFFKAFRLVILTYATIKIDDANDSRPNTVITSITYCISVHYNPSNRLPCCISVFIKMTEYY